MPFGLQGSRLRSTLLSATVTAGALVISLVAGEAVLRVAAPPVQRLAVWPSNVHAVFTPDLAVAPGVSREAHFVTNAIGLRGEELPSGPGARIVTVGGSAAECLYLDSGKTWPDLIARGLTQNGITAWVGNAGISGRKAEHHLAVLENLPFDRYGVDVVIELVGVNDLASFLKHDGVVKSTPSEIMAQTFIGNPRAGAGPWYKRTRLWQTAKRAVRAHRRYQNQLLQNVDASMLTRWRTYRREATQIRETLPDLREGLSEYAGVLNRTVDVARARGLRLILLTQPALWRADLSPREDSLLWSGGVGEYQREGGHPYYSAPALEQGLMAYNRVLLDVCERRGVECIDLASKLPKDLTVFYDDAHFNEAGARTVADIVVAYLTANP